MNIRDYLAKSNNNNLWIFKKGLAIEEKTQLREIVKEQNEVPLRFYLGVRAERIVSPNSSKSSTKSLSKEEFD